MSIEEKLSVVICPGFHEQALTEQLVRSLPPFTRPYVVDAVCVSPLAVHQWLSRTFGRPDAAWPLPIVGIGFSAGVVGLAGALTLWQQQGGSIVRLIAVDGWGVPLVGLPVCRLSHDKFTHLSTATLDAVLTAGGQARTVNFYADPPVAHLEIWGHPDKAYGWQVNGGQLGEQAGVPMSAAEFLRRSLRLAWHQVSG